MSTPPAENKDQNVRSKRILFHPSDYEELSGDEQQLLGLGYEKAIASVRKNITFRGFSACSLADNPVYGTDINYRSVWARDGALTILWTLALEDADIRQCQFDTLRTLMDHQSPGGQIPANVRIDSNVPEYSGVGGIASIDSVLWVVIAMYRFAEETGDWTLIEQYRHGLDKAMQWLGAQDSNNDGLLEIPEAGDWTDLFARSYHVLYDEVLWHRSLVCYVRIQEHFGERDSAAQYTKMAEQVKRIIIRKFWPTTVQEASQEGTWTFTDTQYSLGDARYLVAQVSPFSFSWRCDVYGNLLAYLTNLIDKDRALMTFRFLWGVGANEPAPAKNLYPVVQAGDPEWRDYFTVNLLNLPHHYHNGGIWAFIGGMWVRYLHKLGLRRLARREMVKLARLCQDGAAEEWEFNEWHHGVTGRPMGKAHQAWSAASFIRAAHDLHLDPDSIGHHV